jgi:NADP-reducing hydrogenase subunit HndB
MTLIHSLEDLTQARQEALERRRVEAQQQRFHLRVSLGSCGIAAGAQHTLDAIRHLLAADPAPDFDAAQVRVSQAGCIGLCALEPIVQVLTPDQPPVTYGKVTPEIARRILSQHIGRGLIVQEYVVDNI